MYKTTLPTRAELRAWFPSDLHNYAVILGWQRLAVLDFDDMQSWYDWNLWRIETESARAVDSAFCVKTNRGVHMYFALLQDEYLGFDIHNMRMPGIDFKVHGQVIGPFSTHPTGCKYQAINDFCLPVVEKIEDIMPAELLALAIHENNELTPIQPFEPVVVSEQTDLWSLADRAAEETNLPAMERISRRFRIEQFFSQREKTGANWYAVKCPFHQDDNPSAWINVFTQLFGCHSCNMRPMSVIGLYSALYTGGDVKEAVKRMLS
jgi:hypothetical protein